MEGGGLFQFQSLSHSPDQHGQGGWGKWGQKGPGIARGSWGSLGKGTRLLVLNRPRGPEARLSLKHQARSELRVWQRLWMVTLREK